MKIEYTGSFFRIVVEFFYDKLEIRRYPILSRRHDSKCLRRRMLQNVTLDLKDFVNQSHQEQHSPSDEAGNSSAESSKASSNRGPLAGDAKTVTSTDSKRTDRW